jgi:hypothetical protein
MVITRLDHIEATIPIHYFTQSILPIINLLYTYEDTQTPGDSSVMTAMTMAWRLCSCMS